MKATKVNTDLHLKHDNKVEKSRDSTKHKAEPQVTVYKWCLNKWSNEYEDKC